MISELLLQHKADVNGLTTFNNTPLHWYTLHERERARSIRLPSIKSIDGSPEWHNVHRCAMNGHARVAELLIDAGADRSILNREGHTPETFSKSREVRELIRTRGSSIDGPCHEQCRFDSISSYAHTHQIINRNARSFVRSIESSNAIPQLNTESNGMP